MGAVRPRFLGLASVLLLSLLGLLTAAPSRAEGEGISVTGSGTGWVDITVHQQGDVTEEDIAVQTKGRFGGFALVPHTSTRPVVGALWLPRVEADGEKGRLVALGAWTVYPGQYRLYLIGETHTTVTLPLPGSGFRAVKAARRSGVAYRQVDFTAAASMSGAERRVPLSFGSPRGTLVAAVAKVSTRSATGVDYTAACVTSAHGSCDAAVPTVSAPLVGARAEAVALREPGRYDVVLNVTHGPGIPGDAMVAADLVVLPLIR